MVYRRLRPAALRIALVKIHIPFKYLRQGVI
jgi:hypothetical protein